MGVHDETESRFPQHTGESVAGANRFVQSRVSKLIFLATVKLLLLVHGRRGECGTRQCSLGSRVWSRVGLVRRGIPVVEGVAWEKELGCEEREEQKKAKQNKHLLFYTRQHNG